MKKALFLVLLLSGCDQEFRTRKCLEEVRACYCKPPTHFFQTIGIVLKLPIQLMMPQ